MSYKKGRIYDEKVIIDKNKVEDFFKHRIEKKLPHRYNYAIYQDNNPELALKRDRYEKNLISDIIGFKENCNILDIGCGVGRWGDEFVKRNINRYIGIDFSDGLLNIAKKNFNKDPRFLFFQGKFQNLRDILKNNKITELFDYILVNGVLLYINDDEIDECLQTVADLMKNGGGFYLKEGIGAERRFSLKDFNSEELGGSYNAIYRSKAEWEKLMEIHFLPSQFEIVKSGPMWPNDLENRKETLQYFWIIRKSF